MPRRVASPWLTWSPSPTAPGREGETSWRTSAGTSPAPCIVPVVLEAESMSRKLKLIELGVHDTTAHAFDLSVPRWWVRHRGRSLAWSPPEKRNYMQKRARVKSHQAPPVFIQNNKNIHPCSWSVCLNNFCRDTNVARRWRRAL